MKPQDLVILLKIIVLGKSPWRITDLASSLFLSQSEVSKALERMVYSGLIDEDKKEPSRSALYDLISTSIQYIFPIKPGQVLKGIATAHSSNPLKSKIVSNNNYVWPHVDGKMRGESIEPLYKNLPKAALADEKLHELLSLVDAIRVGKAREQKLALAEIKKRFDL
jgi:hypothetical protein